MKNFIGKAILVLTTVALLTPCMVSSQETDDLSNTVE
jgi:hypothetical protein